MKKQLLSLAAGAIILAMTAPAFATYVAPVNTLVIPQAKVAIVTNGIDDEASWSAEQTTTVFKQPAAFPSTDFSVTFKVCYDKKYLYLFAKVVDDMSHVYDSAKAKATLGGSHMFDKVELFLDLDTNTAYKYTTTYDSNTCSQPGFNRGCNYVVDNRRAARADYKFFTGNTTNGWVVEVAVPWTAFLAKGKTTDDILQYLSLPNGFDISGGDSDGAQGTAGARDAQCSWDTDGGTAEDNAWNNQTVFGVVTFAKFTAINDFTATSSVAYPNPTTGIVNFENVQGSSVVVMNLAGQVVMTSDIINNQIDMSQLSSGIYIARVGQSAVRIIKQ